MTEEQDVVELLLEQFPDGHPAIDELIGLRSALTKMRNVTLDQAAEVAKNYFNGIFTGWKGYTGDSMISLDEAEDVASECGPICAEAIRDLKRK